MLSLDFVACFLAEQKFLFNLNPSVLVSSLLGSSPEHDHHFQCPEVFVLCFLLIVTTSTFKFLMILYFLNTETIL